MRAAAVPASRGERVDGSAKDSPRACCERADRRGRPPPRTLRPVTRRSRVAGNLPYYSETAAARVMSSEPRRAPRLYCKTRAAPRGSRRAEETASSRAHRALADIASPLKFPAGGLHAPAKSAPRSARPRPRRPRAEGERGRPSSAWGAAFAKRRKTLEQNSNLSIQPQGSLRLPQNTGHDPETLSLWS